MGFINFSFETGNLTNLMASLAYAGDIMDEVLSKGVEAIAEDAQLVLEQDTPEGPKADAVYSDPPGHLKDSYYYEPPIASGGIAFTTVMTTQPTKLIMVVYGTGIYGPVGHRIVPGEKKFLWWEGASHPVRSVAGMPPRDFVTPAQDEVQGRALGNFAPFLDQLAAALANA